MQTECPNCHTKHPTGEQPYTCEACGCTWKETPSKRHGLIRHIEILEVRDDDA